MKTICCIAVKGGGKFLLLKRAKNDTFPGLWEFPSGKVEEGENLEQCSKRELLEEAGLEAKELSYKGKSERMNKGVVTVVHHFLVKSFSGSPETSEEHSDLGWFTRKEIMMMGSLEKDADSTKDSTGKVGTDVVNFLEGNYNNTQNTR
jgi:8-oxo-dGTP diphosphatase